MRRPPDPQLALAEVHLRQLAEMREIGLRMLRDVEDDSVRDGNKPPTKIARMGAYDRLTRSIRQIMALEEEITGLRDKRASLVRAYWLKTKEKAVRQSVEHSLAKAKPELDKPRRERLLSDLFRDYHDYGRGSVRDIVAGICQDLGIETDLSIWDEPQPTDITLPAGPQWVVPANGDKPYTVVTPPDGFRTRLPFDSPHLERHINSPPKPG